MSFLALPENRFLPVVFFIGATEFKTVMPPNVLNRDLLPWIRSHIAPLLDSATVQQAGARLDQLSLSTNRKTAARDHVKALQARSA